MDAGNPRPVASASQTNATSQRARKRRRCSSPQDETFRGSSRSKRKPTAPSRPTPPLSSPLFPLLLLPPSQPGEGAAYSTLVPISIVQYPYLSSTHQQPSLPPPSVVWTQTLAPTTPVTVHRGIPTCTGKTTESTKGLATLPSVNYDLASVGFEEQPKGTSLPVCASSVPQQYPYSVATNSRPRLEDLPDPPATQRPWQTIRVLASAALRSEPKGKLTMEDMVDRICSRFEYFQDLQNRAKLKKSIRHALSLYSEFKCSEDFERRGAKKVWCLTDEVPSHKYVRERKRKSKKTTVPDGISQEERVQQGREASTQDVVKESTCIGQNEDIEFVDIVRTGKKEKASTPERSHSVEASATKLNRGIHRAAARSVISQILADEESDDGDPPHSAGMRWQAHRWGMSSPLQNTTPKALLQTPTTQFSPPFTPPVTRSAFGANSMSFSALSTKASGSPVSTGIGSFAKAGTLALKGFAPVHAPIAPSAGPETEFGQRLSDGDGS